MKNPIKAVCAALFLSQPLQAARVAVPVPRITAPGAAVVRVAPDSVRMNFALRSQDDLRSRPDATMAQLLAAHEARVAPVLAYVKGVIGDQGHVEAVREVEQVTSDIRGVITRINLVIKGEESMESKLAAIFDNAKITGPGMSRPVYEVSPARLAQAEQEAARLAYLNAQFNAQAALQPGQALGKALRSRSGRPEISGQGVAARTVRVAARVVFSVDGPQ